MTGAETSHEARRIVVADAARALVALGVSDARLDVIAREPGTTLAKVARSENIVFTIDETLPMGWFRERFAALVDHREGLALRPETLHRLAALLARRPRDIARVDRIEFIATRLLTRELADGQLEALPEAEFFQVLNQLQLGITASDDVRNTAVGFFVDAAQKLQACSSIEQLLSGGLYLELQGYKKSLREKRLDAAVLYASILVSVAITNRLLRLAAGEGIAHRTLLARVASTELSAEKILAAKEDAQLRRRRLQELAASGRRNPRVVVGIAAAVAATILLLGLPPSPASGLVAINGDDVRALSPLLSKAAISEGEGARLLVAHAKTTDWVRLDDQQRRDAVVAIAAAAAKKGAQQVLVFDEAAALVGHTQGKDVLFVAGKGR
jgi:hypothetical protein